ncbi:MAG: hypothetical protein ACYS4W_15095 [Planctomycetota bacterium]
MPPHLTRVCTVRFLYDSVRFLTTDPPSSGAFGLACRSPALGRHENYFLECELAD